MAPYRRPDLKCGHAEVEGGLLPNNSNCHSSARSNSNPLRLLVHHELRLEDYEQKSNLKPSARQKSQQVDGFAVH